MHVYKNQLKTTSSNWSNAEPYNIYLKTKMIKRKFDTCHVNKLCEEPCTITTKICWSFFAYKEKKEIVQLQFAWKNNEDQSFWQFLYNQHSKHMKTQQTKRQSLLDSEPVRFTHIFANSLIYIFKDSISLSYVHSNLWFSAWLHILVLMKRTINETAH